MKKLLFICLVAMGMGMVSCGNNAGTAETVDTTAVDSVEVVDTLVAVDSVEVDTTVVAE